MKLTRKLIEQLVDEVLQEKQGDEFLKKDEFKAQLPRTLKDVPTDIVAIIRNADNLGFDTPAKAIIAILTHTDFDKRWEFDSPEDLKKVQDYRKSVIKKELDEKLVVASADGTEKTLTSDQKMKAKQALDKGDTVDVKKKGEPVKEEKEPVTEDQLQEGTPVDSVKKLVHDALIKLEQLVHGMDNKRYARYAQSAIKHLENAEDALSDVKMLENQLAEKKAVQDDKDSTKHADQVRKYIGKKFKDKKDIEPVMQKYHKVAKKLSSTTKDPVKTADAIWKHILKEQSLGK